MFVIQNDLLFQKIQSEVSQPKVTKPSSNSRLSQKAILSGVIKKRKVSENNGNVQSEKQSDDIDQLPPKQLKIDNVVTTSNGENTSIGALKQIGILPSICGTYEESSDSENSTDTDDDFDYSNYDWVGRKKISKSDLGGCGQ